MELFILLLMLMTIIHTQECLDDFFFNIVNKNKTLEDITWAKHPHFFNNEQLISFRKDNVDRLMKYWFCNCTSPKDDEKEDCDYGRESAKWCYFNILKIEGLALKEISYLPYFITKNYAMIANFKKVLTFENMTYRTNNRILEYDRAFPKYPIND